MNIVKLQQELIKDVVAGKATDYFIQTNDSEVILMTKYVVYVLDPDDWLLNTDKLIARNVNTTTTANKILDSADNAKPTIKTGVTRDLGGKSCMELKIEDNEDIVYVDTKLLKLFDKSAEYEAINYKSPVYVYESDILVGVVMPVKCGV